MISSEETVLEFQIRRTIKSRTVGRRLEGYARGLCEINKSMFYTDDPMTLGLPVGM